jgi:hypothetical protein
MNLLDAFLEEELTNPPPTIPGVPDFLARRKVFICIRVDGVSKKLLPQCRVHHGLPSPCDQSLMGRGFLHLRASPLQVAPPHAKRRPNPNLGISG